MKSNKPDQSGTDNGHKATKKSPLPVAKIRDAGQKIITGIRHIPPLYWLIMVAIVLVSFLLVIPDYVWIIFSDAVKSQNSLLILVLIFALTTISLVWSVGQRIDVWVFTYFNMHGRRRSWLDGTMLVLTQLGNGIFAMILATLLYFLGYHVLAYAFVLGTLSLWFVVELIKMLVHRTRPYKKIENSRIVGSPPEAVLFPVAIPVSPFLWQPFSYPIFTSTFLSGWLVICWHFWSGSPGSMSACTTPGMSSAGRCWEPPGDC
jgi:hypothetical protein